MAKAYVTFSCGHTGQVAGYRRADVDYKVEMAPTRLCPDCWRAEQQKENDAENAAAAASPVNAGLPALTGTEKQIAWATTIRLTRLTEFESTIHELISNNEQAVESGKRTREQADQAIAQARLAYGVLLGESESRFWIDSREDSARMMLSAALRRIE